MTGIRDLQKFRKQNPAYSLSLPGIRLPGDRDEQLAKHCIFAVSGAFSTILENSDGGNSIGR
jgi:hypothetical protein